MTTRITTVLLCDNPWHGRDEEPAVVTRRLALQYEGAFAIDLCGPDSAALDEALSAFTAHARPGRVHKSRPAAQRRHTRAVRAWWRRHPVGALVWQQGGRIPAGVTAAYEAAHRPGTKEAGF